MTILTCTIYEKQYEIIVNFTQYVHTIPKQEQAEF